MKAQITARLDLLRTERAQVLASLHVYDGAIGELERLLKEDERLPGRGGTAEFDPSGPKLVGHLSSSSPGVKSFTG